MKIILESRKIKNIIKDYYQDIYSLKSCKVSFETEKIKDCLKEVDLFHNDECHYNVLFKTKVLGKIQDKKGKYHTYYEVLNVESTKEIVRDYLDYDINKIECGFQFYNNEVTGEIDVKFAHMIINTNDKYLRKISK